MAKAPTPNTQARYVQIAQALIGEVSRGEYPLGSALPGEIDLARRFAVSRNTIREAIRILADLGLVTRQPGIGTTVQRQMAAPRFKHTVDSRTELFPYEQLSRQQILSTRELLTDRASAALLGCGPGEKWVCLTSVRMLNSDRIPIAYSRLYLPRHFAAIGDSLDDIQAPSFSIVEAKLGTRFSRLVQENAGCLVPAEAAAPLQVPIGSAALYVVRRFFTNAGENLFVTETYYPEGRFSFSFEMALSDGQVEGGAG